MTPILISHRLCPYVQRAVIALKEKQVEFERIDIDLNAKPDWFLAISPLGKTPVLRIGDHVIFESAVICEYLEETLAPALHPSDPLQRARHRAWMEFASSTLNAIWTLYTTQEEASCDAALKILRERFVQIESALGEGPYFAGARFSLVDAAFAPVFRYFDVFDTVIDGDLFAALPKLEAWRKTLAQRASVRTAVSADYPVLLSEFVIGCGGLLGSRLAARK